MRQEYFLPSQLAKCLCARVAKLMRVNKNSFGNVNVYLFGSRVDDTKKGGDIDIAIESNLSREDFRKTKVKLISYLIISGFDFKIDIVNYNTKDDLLKNQIVLNSQKIN